MTPEIITIRDANSGASAEILVSQGFNCFRFSALLADQPVEVLYAPADFSTGQGRPSRGGIPLLFPFPGRIPGTTFTWEGKPYSLEPGDAFGNAIHGFALSRPWRVIEQGENRVVGQFHAWRDDPALKNRWPADFRITAEYRLSGNSLLADYRIENPCDVSLPCGFGTHPYFRVPLAGATAADCLVKLPVSARWELNEMLPTGRRIELSDAAAYQTGQRFGDMQFDDAFTGLQSAAGWTVASIHDPNSRITMTQRFDNNFRECVVYTPPHREAICIEPLTCVPNCFDLASRGIDAGLKILPPGGTFTVRVEIHISDECSSRS
jgi:aldose 1-epimerase